MEIDRLVRLFKDGVISEFEFVDLIQGLLMLEFKKGVVEGVKESRAMVSRF